MKKLLIFLLLIITANLSYSQQWKVNKRNDAFSGKVSTAYTIGYNGRSPYKNPIIAFKRFQDGTVEGVITGAGSLICSEYYPSITFAFNGKFEDKLRITLTPSNDNEIGYFDEDYSDKRQIIKLIEKLKSSNYAEVLFETSCSTNRFKIGLSGSTKALNEVVGDYYLKKRDSYLASEKIKSDSINALNDAVLPKYLEWKSHIDNDISRIYENYLVRDKYDKNEIYSFEDFKKICYKEIDDAYIPFADDSLSVKFPLISYYKKYTVGHLKKYTNSMVINLSVKTERNRRSKIVGSKIEHYIEIENELISTKKDGSEDDIFAFRQNWILEKKTNFNNDSKIKEETENKFTFNKSYVEMEIDGMDDLNHIVEINGYISFSNSYFTMSSKMRDLPIFETPLEDRMILGDKHWKATVVSYTESSIGEKIKFFIEYNGYNNEYNSDGGILIARYPEQKMKVIYPLNKSLD